MPSRDELLNDPRSGARPLGGSPGPERPIPDAGANRERRAALPPGDSAREGKTAPEGSAGARRGRAGGRPPGQPPGRDRRRPPGGQRPHVRGAASTGRKPAAAPEDDGGEPRQKRSGGGRKRSRPGLPGGSGGARNYQAVILAEFVAAELLVALTPIATRPNQPGLSPYVPRDMTKLLAIGLSYFLLQLMATTGRGAGRFGAWFGLLILLAVGINEASSVAKVLDIFSPPASKTDSTASKGSTSGPPAGSGEVAV